VQKSGQFLDELVKIEVAQIHQLLVGQGSTKLSSHYHMGVGLSFLVQKSQ
jgi:hypothetical protein